MEKVYDITIKDLETILSMLKDNMYDTIVMKDAVRLEEYIKRIKNNFKGTEEISILEQMQDDLEYYPFYKPLYPIIERFICNGMGIDELDSSPKYKSILFSDEQVVSDVIEFYGHQGELFYSQILEFSEEAKDHLKFIKDTTNTDGETLFLKSIGEAFVFSPNVSNITKFTILVHELQHVIDFYINPSFTEEYVIRETIAMFMEMIAADFIVKKYKLYNEGFKRQQYIHSIVKYQSHNVMYKMDSLELAYNCKKLELDKLIELLNDEGYDKEDLNFYFEQGITTDMAYQIAYLIAMELYMIYYKDKELVLSICEDIIKNGTSDNIFDLLDKYGIKLNNSVADYENNIFKKRF